MVTRCNHISFTASQTISQSLFEELFCCFYPKIAAYATTILDDKTVGEDIAQEVFVYVWEKRNELHMGEGFYSYLFQSAYSRCIDYIKKNSRLEKYVQEALLKSAIEYHSYIENDCQPLKELFSKDFEEQLNALLSQLPEARRRAFELVYRDGLKMNEVAEKLQMPQRTVESHIYLTIKYLRKHLSPYDFLLLMLICEIF
ncbi:MULTISPECIES: RNA polymerase sigma-70 factor [Proteiniphilum]|uniref:RNA polymerase sigma-70 factor n=1 Tax=Proteiniphilum TaxID=294702 RepID=UPI001EEA7E52|nr:MULTISPECIES: RNA polymerase sigma-70 factor [Proteiniphilum]